ncbi:MAG: tetratricopeptide repeat protein [Bacteroidota bacterium]
MRWMILFVCLGWGQSASGQIAAVRAAAYEGDGMACLKYSKALYKGTLVDQDRDSAAYYMQRALLSEDPAVLQKAAKAYQFGLGADKDEREALRILRLAAALGHAEAILELSEAFRFGMGVEKSDDSADHYLNQVAELGDPDGQFLVGTRYLQDAFSARNYPRGLNLLKKAAEQGHTQANWRLCEVFAERGTGTQSDNYYSLIKAYSFAEKAAEDDLPEALLYCARARLQGQGTPRNDSLAIRYVTRAADSLVYLPAYLQLGELYWDATMTGEKDPLQAMRCFRLVKEHRRANAEQRGTAELGIHQIDQYVKHLQNTMLQAGGWVPPRTFDYFIRE